MRLWSEAAEFRDTGITEAAIRAATAMARSVVRKRHDVSDVQRILVLQLQQLGDTVVFTPTLRALRERFPAAVIDVLCSSISHQFYAKCQLVDRLWLATWLRPSGVALREAWLQLRELRRQKYDLAISDVTQISGRHSAISWLAGARTRIGFDVDGRGSLLTWRLARPRGENFVRCNLAIADVLGARGYSTQTAAYFDEGDLRYIDERLNGIEARQRLIAIHPAANWQSKTWFPERWARVADILSLEEQATVIFVGAATERSYVEHILSLVRHPARSLVASTTLSQLAALMTRVDLFIGTDSGPRHVAAGSNCPRVILMSAQDRPERWQFDDPREVVLRTDPACSPCFKSYCSHRTCMNALTDVQVLTAARRVLASTNERHVSRRRLNCTGVA